METSEGMQPLLTEVTGDRMLGGTANPLTPKPQNPKTPSDRAKACVITKYKNYSADVTTTTIPMKFLSSRPFLVPPLSPSPKKHAPTFNPWHLKPFWRV
jgi:hypothetical protein